MLAVSPVRNTTRDENETGGGGGDVGAAVAVGGIIQAYEFTINPEGFLEDDGNLLEIIDFDDLLCGMEGGDSLPDLEIDPEILAGEFSDQLNASSTEKVEEGKGISGKGEEVVSKRDEEAAAKSVRTSGEKKRKYSSKNNNTHNSQGKRKVKVDWTPELHRRFVQAVEQLGVDKAVPSRILELMGIDCLTRHNVASHLQKYRSHRKHLLAREAEAASWTHKRQIYGAKNGWLPPTIGFPPPMAAVTPPGHHHHPHFRPLHVWGHPKVPSAAVARPPFWAPLPPSDPSCWQPAPTRPSTPGTPCYPQPLVAPTTFGSSTVAGIPRPLLLPHHSIYRANPGVGILAGLSGPRPPVDLHPSKESIDAAIGDVLTKPWLPLPLGLKPPSTNSVMVELHRHGVSDVLPTPSCA